MDTLTHLWEYDLLIAAKEFIFWPIWLHHRVWSCQKPQYRASLCPIRTHKEEFRTKTHSFLALSTSRLHVQQNTHTLGFFCKFLTYFKWPNLSSFFWAPMGFGLTLFSTPNEPKLLPIVSAVFFHPTAHLAPSHQSNSSLFPICTWKPHGNHEKWPHYWVLWWPFA